MTGKEAIKALCRAKKEVRLQTEAKRRAKKRTKERAARRSARSSIRHYWAKKKAKQSGELKRRAQVVERELRQGEADKPRATHNVDKRKRNQKRRYRRKKNAKLRAEAKRTALPATLVQDGTTFRAGEPEHSETALTKNADEEADREQSKEKESTSEAQEETADTNRQAEEELKGDEEERRRLRLEEVARRENENEEWLMGEETERKPTVADEVKEAQKQFKRLLKQCFPGVKYAPRIHRGKPRRIILLHEPKQGRTGSKLSETEVYLKKLFEYLEVEDIWVVDGSPGTATPKGQTSTGSPNPNTEPNRRWVKSLITTFQPDLLLHVPKVACLIPKDENKRPMDRIVPAARPQLDGESQAPQVSEGTILREVKHPATTGGGRADFVSGLQSAWRDAKLDHPTPDAWSRELDWLAMKITSSIQYVAKYLLKQGSGQYNLEEVFAREVDHVNNSTRKSYLREFRRLVKENRIPGLSMVSDNIVRVNQRVDSKDEPNKEAHKEDTKKKAKSAQYSGNPDDNEGSALDKGKDKESESEDEDEHT